MINAWALLYDDQLHETEFNVHEEGKMITPDEISAGPDAMREIYMFLKCVKENGGFEYTPEP